ncbi:MAG TPA: HyaD/HybD family hydrogenase maturation endopeptidase [Anaeromyxobacteraceae bacterium]|nr:HyaD/HybD family hydrogenase maturation endopeptidase [Anaeromyxobacteraceae bacterium]
MTARPIPLLVLGLGNPLCGDDGLGVAAVEELLRRYQPPASALVLDGGTLGLSLLPYLEDAEQAILVDAVRQDAPPGSLVRLSGAEVRPAVESRLSVHQVGVADLVGAADLLGHLPRRLALLGLVPGSLNLGIGLSPAVAPRLGALVEAVAAEARDMGHRFLERNARAPDLAGGSRSPGAPRL